MHTSQAREAVEMSHLIVKKNITGPKAILIFKYNYVTAQSRFNSWTGFPDMISKPNKLASFWFYTEGV